MKSNRRLFIWIALLALPAFLLLNQTLQPSTIARGKAASQPLPPNLNQAQQRAQDLALTHPTVQDYTVGQRTEVFGIRTVGQQYTTAARACATATCWQVEIYNFDTHATILTLVDTDHNRVLDVLHLPQARPGANQRLVSLAANIALNAPQVAQALGGKPDMDISEVIPMDAVLNNSPCARDHLCSAAIFSDSNNRALWAFVDLTTEEFIGTSWTTVGDDGSTVPFTSGGCPSPGTVERAGWHIDYSITGTDGLRTANITYKGLTVANNIKLIQWHADYGEWGFQDYTGCGGGGGGYHIEPFGDTRVINIFDDTEVIGFEIVQDFRMPNWGANCNYRYEQHHQFFNDGRFRVVSGAFGQGCGTEALYRPVVRLDLAINGDDNDNFSIWDGTTWQPQSIEFYRTPYMGDQGPHQFTPEGYAWRIHDDTLGFYIEPGQGQFDDGGLGDDPFIYVTLHKPNEGDTDMPNIGGFCCHDNYWQGPHLYVNDEPITNANLVFWYVPQMQTEANPDSYYCWTVDGEPRPSTYPCFSGPMFVPMHSDVEINHYVPWLKK